MKIANHALVRFVVACTVLSVLSVVTTGRVVHAADHGDAPGVAGDQGADLADVYFFVDPNDDANAVIITTVRGFIVAGEAVNFAIFDPTVRFRIEIENTGDAIADKLIDVSFSPRIADPGPPGKEILQVPKAQTATIVFEKFKDENGKKVKEKPTAPATNPSLAATAPTQVVTDLNPFGAASPNVHFFAGEVDDPFFFDIPAFGRFVASVRNGSPDTSVFSRGRDTFAGYNVLAIAIELPVAELLGTNGNTVGVSISALRKSKNKFTGTKVADREGVPAVNVVLVPFNRKNEYNGASPKDDAKGRFASDIVATLQAFGTPQANIDVLAGVAVLNGDILRLDTSVANTGGGGGDNAGNGFPNGRRPKDDVVDTLLTLVAGAPLGDNVNGSDIPPQNTFPFVAPSQQPFGSGVTDDNTRN